MKTRSLIRCVALAPVLLALFATVHGEETCIRVDAAKVTGTTSRHLTGVAVCDANHEVYGGLYSQMIMGEHFAEPALEPALKGFEMWGGGWLLKEGAAEPGWTWTSAGRCSSGDAMNTSLLLSKEPLPEGVVSAEVLLKSKDARRIGLFVRGWRRPDTQGGPKGLVVLLEAKAKRIQLAEFDLKKFPFLTTLQSAPLEDVPLDTWIKLSANWNASELNVSVNGKSVLRRGDLVGSDANAWGLISSFSQGAFRNLSCNGAPVPMTQESERTDEVSRQWQPIRKGDARGSFILVSNKPLAGKQCQRVEFSGGQGVVGLGNSGLHGYGMNFVAGKEYEGVLVARTAKPLQLTVALESADGLKTYAQQELNLAPGDWQKLEFKLTPVSSDAAGRFAVTLQAPGAVELGYAFLQPGSWSRYKGLPVRRDIMEEMLANGVSVIRFSAALAWMNDKQWKRDSEYFWKAASGPRELRRPYAHCFNTYASGGWSWLEMLDLCAAADILPIPNFSMMEKPQDLLDFIEYANGPADSAWGKVRTGNGHPEPFNLRHIQLGNEWAMVGNKSEIDEEYWKLFEPIAEAIWSKDPKMIIIVGSWGILSPEHPKAYLFQNILRLAKKHDAEVWFDFHLSSATVKGNRVEWMAQFAKTLHQLAEGAKFKAVPLELNACAHNIERGLATAHILGGLSELGQDVPVVCGSNAMESDLIYENGWSQGLVFFNTQKAWSQPPGHVMRMITASRLPLRIKSEVTGSLCATAETDEARKKLTLRVLNANKEPVAAKIILDGFGPCEPEAQVSQLFGPLAGFNSAENPEAYAARPSRWNHAESGAQYSFPANSFTVIQFEKK